MNHVDNMKSTTILSSKSDIDKVEKYKSIYNKLLQYLPDATMPENANSSMLFIDLKKLEGKSDIIQSCSDLSVHTYESVVYNFDATMLIRTSVPNSSLDMLQLYIVIQTSDNNVHTATYCIPQNYMPQAEIENALCVVL